MLSRVLRASKAKDIVFCAYGLREGSRYDKLTSEERAAQQAELNGVIAGMDVVITTAQVPGRKPPVLVTADAVHAMRPGSVIVDMAASALGGNCELSLAGETTMALPVMKCFLKLQPSSQPTGLYMSSNNTSPTLKN